jgi:hypothetical protein
MRKIIVHNPCNEHTRYFRNYNLFWDDLTEELKKKYDVTENRYYEFANQQKFEVLLKNQTCPIGDFVLLECEYVIEFEDTGEFYIMSVSDDLSHATLNEKSNPLLQKVLISQFNRKEIMSHVGEVNIHKYEPWIYFPCTIDDLEIHYEKRKTLNEFIDKMYFRGTSILDRPIVTLIDQTYLNGYNPIGGPPYYFNDLINYKIGLSVAGRGELCYRDIEYMALGIPFLRFEYLSELNPNLIPNFHYISVERPEDLLKDRLGDIEHAKMVEKRFLEVKDDKEFLDFISNNAREYYTKFFNRKNYVKHTLNLLNI